MVYFNSTKFFDPRLLSVLVNIIGPNYLIFFVFELQLQEKLGSHVCIAIQLPGEQNVEQLLQVVLAEISCAPSFGFCICIYISVCIRVRSGPRPSLSICLSICLNTHYYHDRSKSSKINS